MSILMALPHTTGVLSLSIAFCSYIQSLGLAFACNYRRVRIGFVSYVSTLRFVVALG